METNNYRKYKSITKDEANSLYPSDVVDYKFGDWILFQHIKYLQGNEGAISEPILALFVGEDILDMAQVIYFVENEIPYTKEEIIAKKENRPPKQWYVPIIENIILWHDSVLHLGNWNHKPSISELKEALKEQYKL